MNTPRNKLKTGGIYIKVQNVNYHTSIPILQFIPFKNKIMICYSLTGGFHKSILKCNSNVFFKLQFHPLYFASTKSEKKSKFQHKLTTKKMELMASLTSSMKMNQCTSFSTSGWEERNVYIRLSSTPILYFFFSKINGQFFNFKCNFIIKNVNHYLPS